MCLTDHPLQEDTATGEHVAVKRVHAGRVRDGVPAAAYSELKALHELRHPNIVLLKDVFARKGRVNLVLELCSTDLETLLQERSKPLPLPDVKAIMVCPPCGL